MKNNKKSVSSKANETAKMTLDDAARVKVLSPSRLVFKRFIRNKLAIFGMCILISLFLFCFVGPLFYPYAETEIFYDWREQNGEYAYSQIRTEFVNYWNPDCDADTKAKVKSVERYVNLTINNMKSQGTQSEKIKASDGTYYELIKLSDEVYVLTDSDYALIASCEKKSASLINVTLSDGYTSLGSEFEAALKEAVKNDAESFDFGGKTYNVEKKSSKSYYVYCTTDSSDDETFYFASSILTPAFYDEADFTAYDKNDGFKYSAFVALYTGESEYTYDGVTYTTAFEDGVPMIYKGSDECAYFTDFIATNKSNFFIDINLREALANVIYEMRENSSAVGTEVTFTALAPKLENGKEVFENGEKVMTESEFTVKREQNDYTVWRVDSSYLILIYESPSAEHILGTDANGMDVFARIMYGGRISLLVGFVVVFIEMFLGVIMGGIAGFFGGWVDNIIMRLVDIFYCIPSMPILIITGAMFDSMGMNYKERLVWMMAILGILGWAGVARLVRGQILSLREQEFMVAAEASGLSTSRRIFRHLVPNVMPQLIVQATMGLGSVIITESTLSFLGLGVKHPLATWGNMMNNITQKVEYLSAYAYIWVPIGALICLAVIAFNFVGDGLRDAFDPKMKR